MTHRAALATLACVLGLVSTSPAAADDACAGPGARSLLAITPFDPPVPSFSMWDDALTESSLRRAFGTPRAVEHITPGGKPEEGIASIGRSWSFEGMRIETVHSEGETEHMRKLLEPNLIGGEPELWVELVEVTSASKPLRCGIRVGIPLARVREILGAPPDGESDGSCEVGGTDFALHTKVRPYFQGGEDPGVSLCVESDATGVVTRIRWRPLSSC